MNEITRSPVFGALLSLITYEIGIHINREIRSSIFNPLPIAVVAIIVLLARLDINYEGFNVGGQFISSFLCPATVALALPIYERFALFQEDALPILTSILCSNIYRVIFVILGSKFLGISGVLIRSLIPKSIMTPIGTAVSQQPGGIQLATVVAVILTSIIGSILSPILYKFFKMDDKITFGIAIGASSHAIGTTKAMELGETEGATSSLTMAVSEITTVFLALVIQNVFVVFFH